MLENQHGIISLENEQPGQFIPEDNTENTPFLTIGEDSHMLENNQNNPISLSKDLRQSNLYNQDLNQFPPSGMQPPIRFNNFMSNPLEPRYDEQKHQEEFIRNQNIFNQCIENNQDLSFNNSSSATFLNNNDEFQEMIQIIQKENLNEDKVKQSNEHQSKQIGSKQNQNNKQNIHDFYENMNRISPVLDRGDDMDSTVFEQQEPQLRKTQNKTYYVVQNDQVSKQQELYNLETLQRQQRSRAKSNEIVTRGQALARAINKQQRVGHLEEDDKQLIMMTHTFQNILESKQKQALQSDPEVKLIQNSRNEAQVKIPMLNLGQIVKNQQQDYYQQQQINNHIQDKETPDDAEDLGITVTDDFLFDATGSANSPLDALVDNLNQMIGSQGNPNNGSFKNETTDGMIQGNQTSLNSKSRSRLLFRTDSKYNLSLSKGSKSFNRSKKSKSMSKSKQDRKSLLRYIQQNQGGDANIQRILVKKFDEINNEANSHNNDKDNQTLAINQNQTTNQSKNIKEEHQTDDQNLLILPQSPILLLTSNIQSNLPQYDVQSQEILHPPINKQLQKAKSAKMNKVFSFIDRRESQTSEKKKKAQIQTGPKLAKIQSQPVEEFSENTKAMVFREPLSPIPIGFQGNNMCQNQDDIDEAIPAKAITIDVDEKQETQKIIKYFDDKENSQEIIQDQLPADQKLEGNAPKLPKVNNFNMILKFKKSLRDKPIKQKFKRSEPAEAENNQKEIHTRLQLNNEQLEMRNQLIQKLNNEQQKPQIRKLDKKKLKQLNEIVEHKAAQLQTQRIQMKPLRLQIDNRQNENVPAVQESQQISPAFKEDSQKSPEKMGNSNSLNFSKTDRTPSNQDKSIHSSQNIISRKRKMSKQNDIKQFKKETSNFAADKPLGQSLATTMSQLHKPEQQPTAQCNTDQAQLPNLIKQQVDFQIKRKFSSQPRGGQQMRDRGLRGSQNNPQRASVSKKANSRQALTCRDAFIKEDDQPIITQRSSRSSSGPESKRTTKANIIKPIKTTGTKFEQQKAAQNRKNLQDDIISNTIKQAQQQSTRIQQPISLKNRYTGGQNGQSSINRLPVSSEDLRLDLREMRKKIDEDQIRPKIKNKNVTQKISPKNIIFQSSPASPRVEEIRSSPAPLKQKKFLNNNYQNQRNLEKKRSLALLDFSSDLIQLNKQILEKRLPPNKAMNHPKEIPQTCQNRTQRQNQIDFENQRYNTEAGGKKQGKVSVGNATYRKTYKKIGKPQSKINEYNMFNTVDNTDKQPPDHQQPQSSTGAGPPIPRTGQQPSRNKQINQDPSLDSGNNSKKNGIGASLSSHFFRQAGIRAEPIHARAQMVGQASSVESMKSKRSSKDHHMQISSSKTKGKIQIRRSSREFDDNHSEANDYGAAFGNQNNPKVVKIKRQQIIKPGMRRI